MNLYVVRHGIAIPPEDPACPPDPERWLTPKGVERTREMAQGLRALDVRPEVFLTSPYVRAVQTAAVVADVAVVHEQVVVADHRVHAAAGGTEAQARELPDLVAVPDHQPEGVLSIMLITAVATGSSARQSRIAAERLAL